MLSGDNNVTSDILEKIQKLKKQFGEDKEKEKIKFNKKIEEIQKGKDKVEETKLKLYEDLQNKDKEAEKQMEKLIDKTEGTINIIVKRFNQRIEEAKKKKEEEEKTIKSHFDRIYAKSFDYRSFKFKNFDKKNNNAKAFLKEIANRKKDK